MKSPFLGINVSFNLNNNWGVEKSSIVNEAIRTISSFF